MNLTPVFNQYLRHTAIPKLELKANKGKLEFRWKADVAQFNMPVDVKIKNKKYRLFPKDAWTISKYKITKPEDVEVQTNDFYITVN